MAVSRRLSPLIVATLAACGGDGATTPTTPVLAATVTAASSIRFTPPTVNLAVGGTVTFQFQDVQHDVFFDDGAEGAPANIPAPTANASVTRTFDTPGRYDYNCHIHPGMSGVIIVH